MFGLTKRNTIKLSEIMPGMELELTDGRMVTVAGEWHHDVYALDTRRHMYVTGTRYLEWAGRKVSYADYITPDDIKVVYYA